MRIGIDGSCLSNRRGFGRFARESLGALARLDSPHELVVVLDEPSAPSVELPERYERVVVPVREAPSAAASSRGRRSILDMLSMGKAVAKSRLDLFYFPASYTFFPIWNVPKVVVTMHDTLALKHANLVFPNWRGRLAWTLKEHLAVRWSDRILTVSEASRNDLLEWFRLPNDRVDVITEGPDKTFTPGLSSDDAEGLLRRHGLEAAQPFLLYVGGLSPHKNLPRLIEAFARAEICGVKLVLVGDIGDVFHTHVPELRATIERFKLNDRVIFTGFISDADLVHFYRRAIALVQPSLAEGFGLPPIEAMACGTPVIASRIPALVEVIGSSGLFFDPLSVDEIARTLEEIVNDPKMRAQLAARSLIRAQSFTWEKSAKLMLATFEDLTTKGV